jgi:hypothetical protein
MGADLDIGRTNRAATAPPSLRGGAMSRAGEML